MRRKISPLTIAIIVVILAIIIPFSIMIAKLSITGKVVSEAETRQLQIPKFPVKNAIFTVLMAITVISIIFTAKRIARYKYEEKNMKDFDYGVEIKQAQTRAKVKNILNNFINTALENNKTEKEIIKDLASAGWPEDYVKRYVSCYIKNMQF